MTRIKFGGLAPFYVPIEFLRDDGSQVVYGWNLFPGEQSIDDAAWAALGAHPMGIELVQAQGLELVISEGSAEPVQLPSEVVPPPATPDTPPVPEAVLEPAAGPGPDAVAPAAEPVA